MEKHILRVPNAASAGKNGFIQGFTEIEDDDNLLEIKRAVENHRRASFVVNHMRREVPDFETMRAQVEEPNKLVVAKERLESLRENHIEDLDHLYAYQTYEYEQEMKDRRATSEEDWPPNIEASAKFQIQKLLYTGSSKDAALEARWQNDYEMLRYSHLKEAISLEKEIKEIERQQEITRKLKEKMFPQDIEDFKKKGKDVQLRAARFLVANDHEREKMLTAFGWAHRQTEPLQEIFKKDKRFEGHVRSMVLADITVTDPRRAKYS